MGEGKKVGPASRFLERALADVAPAEAFRPSDAVHGGIGALLRLRHGLAQRADIEHAPAIGDDLSVFSAGAGMENFHAFDLRRLFEARDHAAFGVAAGI